MPKKLSPQQQKKRNTTLIALAVFISFLALLVFLSPERTPATTSVAPDSSVNATIDRISKSIEIRRDIFENNMLEEFKTYTPIETVGEWGRNNPFQPYQ